MSFWQQLIADNFRLIFGLFVVLMFTGGAGYMGNAYFTSGEIYGLVQSAIAQIGSMCK